jgi:hypothetical protein
MSGDPDISFPLAFLTRFISIFLDIKLPKMKIQMISSLGAVMVLLKIDFKK